MAGHAQLMREIQTRRWGAGTQAQFDHRAQRVTHLQAALAEARAELELARRSHEAAREHDGRLERQLRELYALWRPGWPHDLAGDVCGRIFAYTSRPDVARCVASCARISQAVERAGVIRFVPPRGAHISLFSTGLLVGAGHDVAVFLESGDRVDATRVDVPCPVSALAAGGSLNVCAAADGQVYVWDMRAGRRPWPVFETASGRAVTDAVALAAGAKTIVLVGSDGALLQATVDAAVPLEPLVPSPHLVGRVEADNGAVGFVGCVVGFMTAYAWDARGGVWAWSLGNARALRVLTRLTRVVKVVAAGDDDAAIAMTDYGQLWSFSASTAAAMLLMGARVLDVAAGSLHVLYVSTENLLYGYGSSVHGVLPQEDGCSPGPVALKVGCGPVIRVAAHRQRSACLAVDGTVWTWGPAREPRLVTQCLV